jgi:hypothetical protein
VRRGGSSPPSIGHWAGSQHRPKADMQGERASLRDIRIGNGSRRSRGPTGRIRRAPRRRHLSPPVRAASRPRAAGPRAGGVIRDARPGRSPSRLKAPLILPQRESADRGHMRQRSSPKGPRPLRGSVKPRVREDSAKTEPQRTGRNRARSRPKVGRRRLAPLTLPLRLTSMFL